MSGEPVQAAIWHCLNHYAYEDATFLAERLFAEAKSDTNLFLLATCYYRSKMLHQSFWLLSTHQSKSPQCRYLLAKCAIELKKYSEIESILIPNDSKASAVDEMIQEFGDLACFALQILAKVYILSEQTAKAIDANRRALKQNPFLWQSFVELCNRGDKPDASSVFSINPENENYIFGASTMVINSAAVLEPPSSNQSTCDTPVDYSTPIMNTSVSSCPQSDRQVTSEPRQATPDSPMIFTLNNSSFVEFMPQIRRQLLFSQSSTHESPTFGFLPLIDSPQMTFLTPTYQPAALTEANDQKLGKKPSLNSLRAHMGHLIGRKDTPLQISKPVFSQSGNVANTTPQTPAQNVRRSSRLFSNSYSVKENNKSPNRNKFVTPKSPSRKNKQRIAKSNMNKNTYNELNERNRAVEEKIETITSENKEQLNNGINSTHLAVQQALYMQRMSVSSFLSLLEQLGRAYLHLSQFQCRRAIDVLSDIPLHQYNTGWVLTTLGQAHLEITEYEPAVRFFEESHELEPFRMDRMEMYSTALWHRQKEVALSALAQQLLAQDRLSPVALLVTGNCFSLQKEHDTAIKFFERAVQIDPSFTYAYTLLGHELVNTEELDKALSCFRTAVRLNPRHYNAWFGIGTIYSKQERYELAEIHFKRALSINMQSSVLMCHVGVMQQALKKTDKALQTLNRAIELDPKNPLSKFHRGSLYFAIGRDHDALNELEELKEIAPKESLVYYLIGKVHNKLGNVHLALMYFSWATDLDPKGANNQIKEAFDPNSSGQADDSVQGTSPEVSVRQPEEHLFRHLPDLPEPEPDLSDADVSF